MILKENATRIGYIQKNHGVKGELALALTEGVYSEDLDSKFLFLDIDNGLVPFFVENYRIKGPKSMLIKLETVDSESRASQLCGSEVYIDSALVESDNQLTSAAFVGYQVFDKDKGYIGDIREVLEIVNNPLFALTYEGKEILFPINPDFIIAVNDAEKTIQVDLPEGLIDLYLEDSSGDKDDFI